jgi:hypothetical protein
MVGPVLRAGAWPAVVGISGAAFILGEPASLVVDVTPTGLVRRIRIRALALLAPLAAGALVMLAAAMRRLALPWAVRAVDRWGFLAGVTGLLANVLLVLGLMPFAVQTDISYAGLVCIFGWVFAASRAGRAAGPRPRQVANCGLVLGAAGMAGAALLAASVPMPAHSLSRDITSGCPRRLREEIVPRGPGSRASSAASGHMVMRGEGHTT